ncbi:zinc finger protein 729-like [Palaemon carinicauda]|uniref:zinc finger protein 729-like n=1 Tax=Palaemon carinicauda TaxID=392227 RepID=UPI0035B5DFED
MENSASGRSEISKSFSDGSYKKDSSIIYVYGDLSDTASTSTNTGVIDSKRGEQANASASCIFSENDVSFKHTAMFENPPREPNDCEEDPPDSSHASCSPLSDQGEDFTSIDVINEKCSKGSLKNQIQRRVISKNQRDRVCELTINNPPIMIKKVTPISKSHQGISKSKLPSVSVLNKEILTNVHLKRYPPISVRKTVPLLESRTPSDGGESQSKSVAPFNRMNAQHSAQCMKQGQVKCDFVCSLYKSNDWTKNSTPNFVGKFKQKSKKKSAHVVVKNITKNNKVTKLLNEDNTFSNEAKHLKCLFCEKYFGWKAITCLKLDGPLPSSFMNPVSLLQHFGITLSVPVYGPDKKDLTFINVCHVCYNLVVNGDELYQKFQSIANQMRQLWPKHAVDNNSSGEENFHRYSSPAGESYETRTVSDVEGKKKNSGRKPQYILPKSKIDESVSVNVIISPDLEALINMNEERYNSVMDEEKVKPKIVRTEPLTCGLCGKDFYADDQWKYHLDHYHRVQKKWHRFTPKSHTTFRGHIISELIKFNSDQKGFEWCNDYKSRQSVSKEGENNHTCVACGNTFSDQSSFVVHLRNFHNIVVDDSLLFGTGNIASYKKPGNQKSDKEKVSNQSKIISEEEQGLAKGYPDRDVHFNTNKLENVEENECDKSEILHKSCLETDAVTSGNSLLSTVYSENQNLGDTALSSDGHGEKPDFNRDGGQKNDTLDDTSSTEYKCLICFKNFSSKEGLENHVETTHLSSSVILKGDETVGIVDCSVDVQDGERIVRKLGEEPSLSFEGTVDRTAELMDWQSDNILGNSYLSDKLKSNKNQLDKEMLRHLVYECELCSRRIAGKKLLLLHMKRMHNISMDLPIAGRLRYCKYCLFRCADHHLLRDHQKEKHGHCKEPDRQQCETCGKIYSSKYIQEHKSVMHGSERKHSCSFCGMKFFDKKGWRNHFYLEHANKEWKCVKCDLVFKKYHQLRQHVSYIHSTKEFKCDKCSKTYKRKGDLTVHFKRAHEKAVSCCNYCGKQYRSISKLKVHLVNVHGLSREETYSHRYARHKRANNKLCLADKASTSNLPSEKTLEIPEGSEVGEACIRIEKGASELQLAEVIESTSNDLDDVTVLILS